MKELDSIIIDGRELKYEVIVEDCDFFEPAFHTVFYEGTELKTRKKYWLFGKKITKEIPKKIFQIPINIDDEFHPDHQIYNIVKRSLGIFSETHKIELP